MRYDYPGGDGLGMADGSVLEPRCLGCVQTVHGQFSIIPGVNEPVAHVEGSLNAMQRHGQLSLVPTMAPRPVA